MDRKTFLVTILFFCFGLFLSNKETSVTIYLNGFMIDFRTDSFTATMILALTLTFQAINNKFKNGHYTLSQYVEKETTVTNEYTSQVVFS